jgi:hypothetical protein
VGRGAQVARRNWRHLWGPRFGARRSAPLRRSSRRCLAAALARARRVCHIRRAGWPGRGAVLFPVVPAARARPSVAVCSVRRCSSLGAAAPRTGQCTAAFTVPRRASPPPSAARCSWCAWPLRPPDRGPRGAHSHPRLASPTDDARATGGAGCAGAEIRWGRGAGMFTCAFAPPRAAPSAMGADAKAAKH